MCFTRAYDKVLRHHHNFAIRAVVAVALNATPYKASFFNKLSQGGDRDKFNEELKKWLAGLEVIVTRMCAFYEEKGYEKV